MTEANPGIRMVQHFERLAEAAGQPQPTEPAKSEPAATPTQPDRRAKGEATGTTATGDDALVTAARRVYAAIPENLEGDGTRSFEQFISQPLVVMVRFGDWEGVLSESRCTLPDRAGC